MSCNMLQRCDIYLRVVMCFRVVLAVSSLPLGDEGVWGPPGHRHLYGRVVGVPVLCQGSSSLTVCCLHQCG